MNHVIKYKINYTGGDIFGYTGSEASSNTDSIRIKLFPTQVKEGTELNEIIVGQKIQSGAHATVFSLISDASKIIRFSSKEPDFVNSIHFENLNDSDHVVKMYSYGRYILEKKNDRGEYNKYEEMHENIPKSGSFCILEYCPFGDLLDYFNDNDEIKEAIRSDLNKLRDLFRKILTAIEYCHSKNIISGDIKLENIVISEIDQFGYPEKIKLIDFGNSMKVTGESVTSLLIFTLESVSPEMVAQLFQRYISFNNSNEDFIYTKAGDIFSVGAMFIHLIRNDILFYSDQYFIDIMNNRVSNKRYFHIICREFLLYYYVKRIYKLETETIENQSEKDKIYKEIMSKVGRDLFKSKNEGDINFEQREKIAINIFIFNYFKEKNLHEKLNIASLSFEQRILEFAKVTKIAEKILKKLFVDDKLIYIAFKLAKLELAGRNVKINKRIDDSISFDSLTGGFIDLNQDNFYIKFMENLSSTDKESLSDLIGKLTLQTDTRRISASEALDHPFFNPSNKKQKVEDIEN